MLSARVVLKALRPRFVDQRPFILSHLLTARCNADCVTCLWKMPAHSAVEELSIDTRCGSCTATRLRPVSASWSCGEASRWCARTPVKRCGRPAKRG